MKYLQEKLSICLLIYLIYGFNFSFGQKEDTIYVVGRVRDKSTKQTLPYATASLYLRQDNEELIEIDRFQTDASGTYKFYLSFDKKYLVVGNFVEDNLYLYCSSIGHSPSIQYLTNDIPVSTHELWHETEKGLIVELERNIYLELACNYSGGPFLIKPLYFEEKGSEILTDNENELYRWVDFLMKEPNKYIQINGYCDEAEVANADLAYELGKNRALSVITYLVEHGISPKRLSWESYGSKEMAYRPAIYDWQYRQNRRVEFRITKVK